MTVVVLSPHFDDAVLSCGGWLARHPGTLVATVCSGRPGPGVAADPAWDALAGFDGADEAARSRRGEDLEALARLDAEQLLLGFLDRPYQDRAGRAHEDPGVVGTFGEALTARIGRLLDEHAPEWCLFPLGLVHPDHVTTRLAAVAALGARGHVRGAAYLDLPYGVAFEAAAREQSVALWGPGPDDGGPFGTAVIESSVPGAEGRKRLAVGCYRSQLPLLRRSFGPALDASLGPGAERLRAWPP